MSYIPRKFTPVPSGEFICRVRFFDGNGDTSERDLPVIGWYYDDGGGINPVVLHKNWPTVWYSIENASDEEDGVQVFRVADLPAKE